jgi:hypothetical protein
MKIRLRVERTTRGFDISTSPILPASTNGCRAAPSPGRLARDVAGGHAAVPVGEGHQHAALHQAAAVVVLVLGDQRIFMLAVDDALPERADQCRKPEVSTMLQPSDFSLAAALSGMSLVGPCMHGHDSPHISSNADLL